MVGEAVVMLQHNRMPLCLEKHIIVPKRYSHIHSSMKICTHTQDCQEARFKITKTLACRQLYIYGNMQMEHLWLMNICLLATFWDCAHGLVWHLFLHATTWLVALCLVVFCMQSFLPLQFSCADNSAGVMWQLDCSTEGHPWGRVRDWEVNYIVSLLCVYLKP